MITTSTGRGLGVKEKHKSSVVTVLRKLSMNGDRKYTGAAGKINFSFENFEGVCVPARRG